MKPIRSISCCRALAFGALGLLTLDLGLVQAQTPLEIYRGPTNFWYAVSPGATVKNQVWVSGGTTPYSYQWRFKANPIPWATNAFITLTNVQVIDAGPYDVVVTDAASASITSQIDELRVNETFIMITGSPVTTNNMGTWSVVWFDYDNDGYVDLFNGEDRINGTIRDANLYHNNRDGTFSMVTNAVTTFIGKYAGGAVGDYNNDGRLDLFVTRCLTAYPDTLYRNDGDGVFTAVESATFNTPRDNSESAAWADYDRDGFIDLLVSNGSQVSGGAAQVNTLYRNLGDGTFQKMTANEIGSLASVSMASLGGCVWADFDNDGDPDVWDSGNQNSGLHWNDGHGRFTKLNIGSLPSGMVAATGVADYDNDGFLDLTVVGGTGASDARIQLHHNLGGTNFEDVAISAGITRFSVNPPWAGGWGDYDNDGWLDLLCRPLWSPAAPGVLYRNLGDGTFESIDLGSPTFDGEADGGGGSWADYNNDGFLDLLMAHGNGIPHPNFLYTNNLPALGNKNHWLKVKLEGRVSNRAGIGAKVRVQATVGGRTFWQMREISGSSILGADGPLLIAHFGLGDATNVTTLRVEWPSGNVQELTDVGPDRMLTVIEPTLITPARPSASPNGSVTLTRTTVSGAAYQWRFEGTDLAGQTNRILNLANLTADQEGRYSVVVSTATTLFTNCVYLDIDTNFTVITEGPLVTDLGGGALGGVADIDNDGDLDVSVGRALGTSAVYYNVGNGTFTGVTNLPYAAAGVTTDGWMDFDNDGRPDPMTLNTTRRMRGIHFDNGDGTFSQNEMTGWLLSFADYNRDGLLDFISALGVVDLKNILYRNNGDRTFTSMTASTVGSLVNLSTWGGPCWGDFDDDGWPDIYVPAYASGGNYMFRNDGTGRFLGVNNLVTRTGGSAYAGPIGGNWADYDNDGRLDLCVISLKGGRTAVYRNLGNGEFESPSGAPNLPGHHNFASWADYDNDGFLDLFLSGAYGRNQLFRGQSDGTFTEVTTGSIVWDRPPGSATSYYSALWFDHDNDGFLDLYVMNLDDNRTLYTSQFLYHNNGNANGWLKVRLIGTASNRDAVGAKVRALASYAGAARWQRRDITGGEVFNGGHLYAHFGLGNATRVTTLRIEWPSGAVQELSNLTINQFLTIWEPPAVSAAVRAGGACELTVKAEPNRGWQIKASSDLVDWQTLTVVTNTASPFTWTDTTASGTACRFYRVVERE